MKFKQYGKPFLLLIALFLWNGHQVGELRANTDAVLLDDIQLQPLTEVLKELSEKYEVIFSFETKLLREVNVNFEFRAGENVDIAIKRLLSETGLRYKIIGSKYFIIHQDTKQGNKNARKIKRKLKQVQKLEQKGKLSLKAIQTKSTDKLNSIVHSIVELKMEKTITGTVKDSENNPLIGATIRTKEGSNGTVTDLDGNFSFNVADEVSALIVSYTGFKSMEITLDGRSVIEVIMQEDATILEEVVVVAYGTQKRKDVTGSIASVKAEQIESRPITTIEEGLQGLVPGLNIAQRASSPGELGTVSIRGLGSITAGTQPLWVVDGFPTDQRNAQSINPSDITSVEILKDASSTAIYGSRGANGVIIITTKSGKAGSSSLDLMVTTGVASVPENSRFKVLNAEEYVQFHTEKNGGTTPDFIANNWNGSTDTDWQDLIFRNGTFQNYALSASGGSEKVRY